MVYIQHVSEIHKTVGGKVEEKSHATKGTFVFCHCAQPTAQKNKRAFLPPLRKLIKYENRISKTDFDIIFRTDRLCDLLPSSIADNTIAVDFPNSYHEPIYARERNPNPNGSDRNRFWTKQYP